MEAIGPNSIALSQDLKENSLAGSVIRDEFEKDKYNINNRFVYIKQWLVNLEFKKLKSQSEEILNMFNHVINAINLLFHPYKFSHISEVGKIYFEYNNSLVEIDKLSDGFKNVFMIIGEILYRLGAVYDSKKAFEKQIIIMIDEIDCHLHPKWQLNIIPSLRALFPKSQIIATTHSPFIIDSLKSHEIIKLGGDIL